jgi:hypothetical protein
MVPYPADPLSLNEGDLSRLSAVGVSTGVLHKHRLKNEGDLSRLSAVGVSTGVLRKHTLNIEVDLQSLFRHHVTGCAQLYSLAETPQPHPMPPHLDSVYEGAIDHQK